MFLHFWHDDNHADVLRLAEFESESMFSCTSAYEEDLSLRTVSVIVVRYQLGIRPNCYAEIDSCFGG